MNARLRHIVRFAAVCGVFLCAGAELFAQNAPGKAAAKQQELLRVQEQIRQTKQQLQALDRKETTQTRVLGTYRKQKQIIGLYLASLSGQKAALEQTIAELQRSDSTLVSAMKSSRRSFAGYLRSAYVGSLYQNAADRAAGELYARALTRRMKRYLRVMDAQHDSVARQHAAAVRETAETAALLEQKTTEGKTLETSIYQTQATLVEIRSDKELMRRELAEKQRSAEQIRGMIARLIEEERKHEEARKLAEQKKPKTGATHEKTAVAATFRWPVNSRNIIRKFGQYRNRQTNTVMDNPGIDIAAATGAPVTAAAAGEVSLVHWLPGFNSLVILDHGNGYRTVYANLDKALAAKGQTVAAGTLIGRTGETVDGKFLHFEVWNGAERINPAQMLK